MKIWVLFLLAFSACFAQVNSYPLAVSSGGAPIGTAGGKLGFRFASSAVFE